MSSSASFFDLEIRVGTIIEAEIFSKAKKPAYKLTITFGEFGIRKSSAQITENYSCEELLGKQVIALLNVPPKNIAGFLSECLVLAALDSKKGTILLKTDKKVEDGMRIS